MPILRISLQSELHISYLSSYLTFSHFWPPLTPASDSLIRSLWLPVGSSHSEMYEHREKWSANSIRSIIPEALVSAALWRRFDIVPSISVLLPPTPHPTLKSKLLREKRVQVTVDKRGLVSMEWCTAVKIFIFTGRMLVRSSVKSGVNFVGKQAVNHYTFVCRISCQVQDFIEHYSIFLWKHRKLKLENSKISTWTEGWVSLCKGN